MVCLSSIFVIHVYDTRDQIVKQHLSCRDEELHTHLRFLRDLYPHRYIFIVQPCLPRYEKENFSNNHQCSYINLDDFFERLTEFMHNASRYSKESKGQQSENTD